MSELPQGWADAVLDDVTSDIVGGGTPSKANQSYFEGEIPFMTVKDMNLRFPSDTQDKITQEALDDSSARMIPAGTNIIATRMGLGKAVRPLIDVAINQDLKAIFPTPAMDADFLHWKLIQSAPYFLGLGTGTTVKGVRLEDVRALPIPLPPLPEQRRIVAKVDGLTARTARARKELDRIPTLIARYKQRLLALALCGGLTTDWRNRNGSDGWLSQGIESLAKRRTAYEKSKRGSRLRPSPPLAGGEDAGLPSSWISCCVADVADLRVGYAFKSQWFSSEGTRLIRGANVAPGRIDWSDERRLSQERVSSYEDYVLEAGDVVIAMDRPLISTGLKIAIVGEEDAGALLVQRVANPRPTAWLNPKYLYYVFNGQGFISQIESHATGSDLPHISGNDILTTTVPLPPVEEQAEIVRRIESAFAWLDRVAADHAAATRLLPKLDAAILAKAFQGKLVPQDPGDEPAAKLLERIKAEREAEGVKLKSGRGRKPNGSKAQGMTEKTLAPRDRLLKDSEGWPVVGLSFEAIAMRNAMPHDTLRDALFELLSGPSPALQQRFDTDAEVMVIQRVAA